VVVRKFSSAVNSKECDSQGLHCSIMEEGVLLGYEDTSLEKMAADVSKTYGVFIFNGL